MNQELYILLGVIACLVVLAACAFADIVRRTAEVMEDKDD